MEEESPTSGKTRFYEICQMYNLDSQAMQALADKAGVPKQVVDHMAVSVAVRRMHASSVLAALGDLTGQTWTLDNVKVILLPTFADLHTLHQFDLAILSTTSGVSFDRISMLLRDEPVSMKEAGPILQAASQQTGHHYSLTNVDMKMLGRK
jgi:hypothetical protein